MEHTPEREALEDCCSGDVPLGICSVRHFHPLGESRVTLVGTALGPTSTMGILAHGPGISHMLFSLGHQQRSLRSGPRIAFIVELDLLWCCGDSSDSGLAAPPSVGAHKVSSCYSYTCCDWGSPPCPLRCSIMTELTDSCDGIETSW